MVCTITSLAATLQTLFTTDAADAARTTGFVRRARKLTGPAFAQITVLGWLHNPQASLADLAELAAHWGRPVCPSALDQRFRPAAAAFLQTLLAHAMNAASATAAAEPADARAAVDTLLQRFAGVYLEDCTTIGLPLALAEFFPGCGGSGGRTAALKVPLRLELRHGLLEVSDLQPGRTRELSGPRPHAPLPAGSLRLADLGYYSLEALQAYIEQDVYVLSRLPARTALADAQGRRWKLHEFLPAQGLPVVDTWVRLGARWQVPLRLLAWRVPPAVAEVRQRRLAQRAQKNGRPVSAAQRVLSQWNILVTNAPVEKLSLREACVLARLRWQVELLFKLWKSQGRLDESAGHKPYRVLCELLAKLLGLVVQHWVLLTAGPLLRQSQHRAAKRVRAAAERLAEAVGDVVALGVVLQGLRQRLRQLQGKGRRRNQPAAFQLAENPWELEAAYCPAA